MADYTYLTGCTLFSLLLIIMPPITSYSKETPNNIITMPLLKYHLEKCFNRVNQNYAITFFFFFFFLVIIKIEVLKISKKIQKSKNRVASKLDETEFLEVITYPIIVSRIG